MKLFTFLFSIFLFSSAFSQEQSLQSQSVMETLRFPHGQYPCECNAVDTNFTNFYGWSKTSLDEAKSRALKACWSQSWYPDTCKIYDRGYCQCI